MLKPNPRRCRCGRGKKLRSLICARCMLNARVACPIAYKIAANQGGTSRYCPGHKKRMIRHAVRALLELPLFDRRKDFTDA